MFENKNIDKNLYNYYMNCLKEANKEYCELYYGKEYKLGRKLYKLKTCSISESIKKFKNTYLTKRMNEKYPNKIIELNQEIKRNYFSDERIAIYTCIWGNYDEVQEPLYKPDNCDFFIITDREINEKSIWTKMDITEFKNDIKEFNSTFVNRYFKMHPNLLFPQYKYSIYIDGNIKIISDLTEYINNLNNYGIATHLHPNRNCVYDELIACEIIEKISKKERLDYEKFLQSNGMIKAFGMLECNVIVREHHNKICKEIMQEWWSIFKTGIKRDQLILPLILFKRSIPLKSIGVLGENVRKNFSFRLMKHK